MPEHLDPAQPSTGLGRPDNDHASLRSLSRSPHPYHRLNSDLLEPSNGPFPSFARDSSHPSDSGTDADDEHFLKGLPAPKFRLHKGLRGGNDYISGASTPLLSPAVLEEEGRKPGAGAGNAGRVRDKKRLPDHIRRRNEIVRRTTEVFLLACQAAMVASNADVQPFLRLYHKELLTVAGVSCLLAAAYPLRLVLWTYRQEKPFNTVPLRIPASFDPAPLLYPPLIPVLVSLLVARHVKHAVLPSLVLSLSALPKPLIPGARYWEPISSTQWLLSCIPFSFASSAPQPAGKEDLSPEVLVLLYPLHQTLCSILHHLTTTSLLVSEVQLLSVALILLLLLATSPQAVILKAVLWGGGVGLLALCSHVIQWSISLSRVPKWRFRRSTASLSRPGESAYQLLRQLLPGARPRSWSKTSHATATDSDTDRSADEAYFDGLAEHPLRTSPLRKPRSPTTATAAAAATTPSGRRKRAVSSSIRPFFSLTESQAVVRKWLYAIYVYASILLVGLVGIRLYVQRNALSGNEPIGWALGYLFGDLPAFRFHVVQASLERWICLPPLLSSSSSSSSASSTNTTSQPCHDGTCTSGWVNHLRLTTFGAASTRLFISGYWALVLITGLAIVFRLSKAVEVDTRRKVFHFMMVFMFLPATYVDPCYAALALAIMLGVFLLVDLLRASQLPPLSRPIARFLTPYVDGRDLRGPVVVSHIFLLIGCAIPLWLSLGGLPRSSSSSSSDGASSSSSESSTVSSTENGSAPFQGWDLPLRETAMVAGVVCVGLGDAAASLVGRRWGRHKWLWGGGKSLEGSVAFAAAVFGGLMLAAGWLRAGGWATTTATPASSSSSDAAAGAAVSGMDALRGVFEMAWLSREIPRAAGCAALASLTEAVLTGGNDNVVVPVVLWGCVRSLGV